MKRLAGLGPLLEAPYLEELLLSKAVSLSSTDPEAIAAHPSIRPLIGLRKMYRTRLGLRSLIE